jgi:hypothetical protein
MMRNEQVIRINWAISAQYSHYFYFSAFGEFFHSYLALKISALTFKRRRNVIFAEGDMRKVCSCYKKVLILLFFN